MENEPNRTPLLNSLINQISSTRLRPGVTFLDLFKDPAFHKISNAVRRFSSDREIEDISDHTDRGKRKQFENCSSCWYNRKRLDGRQIVKNLVETLKSSHPPSRIEKEEEISLIFTNTY